MTSPAAPAPLDADQVRAAVAACPGVAEVRGHGPNGVAVARDEVEVHIVARYGIAFDELGRSIDAALAPMLGGRRLQVSIVDVEDPTSAGEESTVAPGSTA